LQSPSVDSQHAIIEYRDIDGTFALQDLNTTYGTYVNDCRIGNAYVRLYPGDVIRFGNSNTTYELMTQGESSVIGTTLEYIIGIWQYLFFKELPHLMNKTYYLVL